MFPLPMSHEVVTPVLGVVFTGFGTFRASPSFTDGDQHMSIIAGERVELPALLKFIQRFNLIVIPGRQCHLIIIHDSHARFA